MLIDVNAKISRALEEDAYFAATATSSVFNMLDERSEVDTLREIYYLTDGDIGNWRKLLALGDCLDQHLKRKLLWVWPTSSNLELFNQFLTTSSIQCILSVGCGSGLLEWLIVAASGQIVSMFGLEVDRNWWQSKYSARSFIPLNFFEDKRNLSHDFLKACCKVSPLMPCYFVTSTTARLFWNIYEYFEATGSY